MKVSANRLDRCYEKYQDEFEKKAMEVLRSGWYVLGNEVSEFEKDFAKYVGAENCVGLASGLDALWIAIKLLGIGKGDEVIVQANTYIASIMGITINGAIPVFVEPNEFYNIDVSEIEKKITKKTKAIMVVHLYGQATQMDKIICLCNNYNLKLIEDCAQSHGAHCGDKMTGTFGDVGCFSFYPSKNLGAFGDAGAVVVKNRSFAEEFRTYRNYGSEKRYYNKVVGANSRLDELQAGLLRVKLAHIAELTKERQTIAARYSNELRNPIIKKPIVALGVTSVWHQYVIRCDKRQELIDYLNEKKIGTIIHYPIPPHLSEAYMYLGHKKGDYPITEHYSDTVVSIPMYNGMTEAEQSYVIECINNFSL